MLFGVQSQSQFISDVSEVPQQENLLAFFNMNQNSGTTLVDDFGAVSNGTLSSDTLWTSSGIQGAGIAFDGTNYVDFGLANNLFGLTGTFTVCFAVKPDTASIEIRALDLGKQSSSVTSDNEGFNALFPSFGSTPYELIFAVDSRNAGGYGGRLRGQWGTGLLYKPGEWNLVFCMRSPTEVQAYIYNSDGVSSNSLTDTFGDTLEFSSRDNYIGAVNENSSTGSSNIEDISDSGASIDMVAAWSVWLNSTERAQLWNGGNGIAL